MAEKLFGQESILPEVQFKERGIIILGMLSEKAGQQYRMFGLSLVLGIGVCKPIDGKRDIRYEYGLK